MTSTDQYHIQARWITVETENGGLVYFKLDDDGDLVLTNGKVVPDHFEYQNYDDNSEFEENVSNFNQSFSQQN